MAGLARWVEWGEAAGDLQAAAIRANLAWFRARLAHKGRPLTKVLDHAVRQASRLSAASRAEIRGMAAAARLPLEELLAFNLFAEWIEPEGCTVALAMPDVTASGDLLFFKNSDKMGAAEGPPDLWHRHKEINVVRIVERDAAAGTRKVIGIAAAGSTIFKMGMNDAGLAGGASLGRIVTSTEQTAAYWGAAGRGELLRDGLLTVATAEDAAAFCLPSLVRTPVSSPGNIQFADPVRAINLECSFTEAAVTTAASGCLVRTNRFELMRQLNRADDTSSPARFARAEALLQEHRGRIDVETMIRISTDHANGPSTSSICRHSEDWREETSLSSAIMRISPSGAHPPEISLALGKPCRAWVSAEGEGWVTLTPSMTAADLPPGFLSGAAWKQYYSEIAQDAQA